VGWEQICEAGTSTEYTETLNVETERCRTCDVDTELKLHVSYKNLLPVCQTCIYGTVLRRDGSRVCACRFNKGYIDLLFVGEAVEKTKSPENSTKLEISGMEGPYMFRKTKTLFCSWTEIIFGICTMK